MVRYIALRQEVQARFWPLFIWDPSVHFVKARLSSSTGWIIIHSHILSDKIISAILIGCDILHHLS